MNTMPTTQLDQAAKALHVAATTLEELHAAATAVLLPAPTGSDPDDRDRVRLLENELRRTSQFAQERRQKIWDLESEMRRDKQTIESLAKSEKSAAAEAAALATTVERMERAHYEATKPAPAPQEAANPAPGYHTAQAMKELGIDPGPQPPCGGAIPRGPAKPHRELALKEACAEVDKLKNERDALGRILLRMGDEVHSFSFDTVEAAAQRNTKNSQAFREIAAFLDTANNSTTEDVKNRIIAAIHDQRTPPPPEAAPAPEDTTEERRLGPPHLDGRQTAKIALQQIAEAAAKDKAFATAAHGLELCNIALNKMSDPKSCTREDLAWALHSLHRLACIGNGGRWGNSSVNELAQDAIRRIRETNPEAVPCYLDLDAAAGYARPNDRGPSPEPPAPGE